MVFGETAVLDDGRLVTAPWKATGIYIGANYYGGPELRMPDAALDADGRVWVVGRDQQGKKGFVWLSSVRQWWPTPCEFYGSRAILRVVGDHVEIAVATKANAFEVYAVSDTGVFTAVAGGVIAPAGGAQGMRDWLRGTARPLANLDEEINGYHMRSRVGSTAADAGATSLLIACNIDPRLMPSVLMARAGRTGTLAPGEIDWPTPRLSAKGNYWCGVHYDSHTIRTGAVPIVVPPLALVPVPVPPTPPVPPIPNPPKPPEPPVPTPDLIAGFFCWTKKFITAEGGGDAEGILHAVDRPGGGPQTVNEWETMHLIRRDAARVYIRTSGMRYWKAEHADTTTFMDPTALVTCHEQNPNPNDDSWELFFDINNGDGTMSLRSQFGFYVCCEADGRITCNRTAIGTYERFQLVPPGSVAPAPPVPGGPLPRVSAHPNDPLFRLDNGSPWRMAGASNFKLANLHTTGGDAESALYAGFNTDRVFAYTEGPNWTDPTWDSPTPQQCVDFVRWANSRGRYIWWVLLTSSNPARRQAALDQIEAFRQAGNLGLFLQGANEPERQNPDRTLIDTSFMHAALAASGYPWDNGYIDDTRKHAGTFCDPHTKRDGGPKGEWPRRCHDLMDIYSPPSDAPAGTVALKMPCVAGEPAKHEDVGFSVIDWKGYFGGCAIFGAGAVFHSKSGKFSQPLTPQERQLADAALAGLNAFPANATLGAYSRIDGDGLRTYIKGGTAMVRIRPDNTPPTGWTSLDSDHVFYKR